MLYVDFRPNGSARGQTTPVSKPHHFTNEEGNEVISQTQMNFTQKQTGVDGSFTRSEFGKSYRDEINLMKHMRVHTGEKL